MKSNRRSVLVGLGTLTVGGGAVLGTGAFSSVEADRTVTVSTTGDGSALLQLTLNDGDFEGLEDTGTNQIQMSFSDLNENATTTFTGALTVGNNGSATVDFEVTEAPTGMTFKSGTTDLSSSSISLGPLSDGGTTQDIDIEIDLTTGSEVTDAAVTFKAEQQ